ncbi:MAG: hypothetical protein EOP06_03810 [Proteobacteria bacterium]|nr:MAG: hypothetical protein EOP06_03810 [Pseudomonadota bacterium]
MTIIFNGKKIETFVEYCLLSRIDMNDHESLHELVDDFVGDWHANDGYGLSLRDAIGMPAADFNNWVADANYMQNYLEIKFDRLNEAIKRLSKDN